MKRASDLFSLLEVVVVFATIGALVHAWGLWEDLESDQPLLSKAMVQEGATP